MQCKCGLLIASTYKDKGISYARCYANHVTSVIKIEAATRLKTYGKETIISTKPK
jgi:hypothetical protein